jgi:hypothetical protein
MERDLQKRKICSRFVPHCEVSRFQIDLCDLACPPNRQIWHRQTFSLFQKVKLALKGERFNDISDIQRGVTEQLKGVSLQDFQRTFDDLYKRSQRCLELGNDYIEST